MAAPAPLSQHCFTAALNDVPVHFQVVQLERQLYIWVGVGAPRLGALVMAVPTRLVRRGALLLQLLLLHAAAAAAPAAPRALPGVGCQRDGAHT